MVKAKVLAIRSEGFGGDFRSGYEEAFRAIMDLMEPPKEKMEDTINILGARIGPTYTEWIEDIEEIERLVHAIGAKSTVSSLVGARLNKSAGRVR